MIIRQTLLGAILLTTIVFTYISAAAQYPTLVLLSLVIGLLWLIQTFRERSAPSSLYFLVFTVLAVPGALANVSLPILLIGIAANLVAWDLARFRQRIRDEEDSPEKARLERSHLQKLAVVIAGGLLISLIPALLTISVNFVVIAVIILVALVVLRQSLLSLRGSKPG